MSDPRNRVDDYVSSPRPGPTPSEATPSAEERGDASELEAMWNRALKASRQAEAFQETDQLAEDVMTLHGKLHEARALALDFQDALTVIGRADLIEKVYHSWLS